ncbi:hypothetical protein DFH07DRAFT_1062235 [Mycena maculata]|uniref:DUF6535 domain-containing protein n=1 Tax=Mycena maculata TaxID=230809 RepID=A0AAD7N8H7_9AGAR|nr:hypothetical protein DFH07DRAFT_1062235 [Mycena maculata]
MPRQKTGAPVGAFSMNCVGVGGASLLRLKLANTMKDVEWGIPPPHAADNLYSDDSEAECAKIWSVYISEAEKYDKALVESWRGDMDGMLIFAGLFSASLTAFIVESYKTLSPDSGNTTVTLLEQISKQLAASTSGEAFQVPAAPVFVVPATSLVCNILWFISLGLSLACALIATLIEQWARDFVQKAEMRPSPVIRARIFSYLYYGLKRFNMHVLVDLVPLLLHMSLILFFAGLVAFLLPINHTVMAVAAALFGILVAVYCSLTVLPLIYLDCPYRTPFSTVLWRLKQLWLLAMSRLAEIRHRRSQEPARTMRDNTMVEIMISQGTKPSEERDKRDRRSLGWTVKSLTDDTELEPFLDGIPDMLWGPNGSRLKHDHLIRALLDDPEVRLGERILGLMRYSDSSLLTPEVEFRLNVSCLKALWSIGTLSQKSTRLNLPLDALAKQLSEWVAKWVPKHTSSDQDFRCELLNYLDSTQAVIRCCILSSFDVLLQYSKSDLQKCEADAAAGRSPSLDTLVTLRNGLRQLVRENPTNHFLSLRFSRGLSFMFTDAPLTRVVSWLKNAQTLLNDYDTFLNDYRHGVIYTFLRASLSSSERRPILYEFHHTLRALLSDLSAPSAYSVGKYSDLLQEIGRLDGTEKDLQHRLNTDILGILINLLFPKSTDYNSSPWPIAPLSTDTLISHFSACLSDPSLDVFDTWAGRVDIVRLVHAVTDYLIAGCPGSNNVETTLKVVCGLYRRSHPAMDSFRTDFLLSLLQSLHDSPTLHTALVLVRQHTLLSLAERHRDITCRLEETGIMGYAPEFRDKFEAKMRLLGKVPERELARIPLLTGAASENMVPTQADWDKLHSSLSHPLLSTNSLGNVLEADPNFDFGACEDDVEKGVQYLNLLAVANSRFCDAAAAFYTEFLDACSSPTLPYSAVNTMQEIATNPLLSSALFAHPEHQIRFAKSIRALMKSRGATPEHTEIWDHFWHSWIFRLTVDRAKRGGKKPDESTIRIIKDSMEEYAESLQGSAMHLRLQRLLIHLDELLERPATIPSTDRVEECASLPDTPTVVLERSSAADLFSTKHTEP